MTREDRILKKHNVTKARIGLAASLPPRKRTPNEQACIVELTALWNEKA